MLTQLEPRRLRAHSIGKGEVKRLRHSWHVPVPVSQPSSTSCHITLHFACIHYTSRILVIYNGRVHVCIRFFSVLCSTNLHTISWLRVQDHGACSLASRILNEATCTNAFLAGASEASRPLLECFCAPATLLRRPSLVSTNALH